MPRRSRIFDKDLLPYVVLAAFASIHLVILLSYIPSILPYTSDDVWMAWKSGTGPLSGVSRFSWDYMREGRLSLVLNTFLFGFAYHFAVANFILQSLPLFLCITTGAFLLGRYTQSLRSGLAFFTVMSFGSFITDQHHLFGAYPAALPLGLTASFAYVLWGLYRPASKWFARLGLAILFALPLFIYEAFFPIQLAAAFIIAAQHTSWKSRATLAGKLLSFIRPVVIEIIILCAVLLAYIVNKSTRTWPDPYQGASLANSFALAPYTFIKYATGFFPLCTSADAILMLIIISWFAYALWKRHLPSAALAVYFILLWLAPPLLLSLTPKYQKWAQAGGSIYVTTFLSEMGCFGLLIVLWAPLGRGFLLLGVTLLSFFMWMGWHEESSHVLRERLERFSRLDAAIAEKKLESHENCFTMEEIIFLLRPWELCETKATCNSVVPYILSQRGAKLCSPSGNPSTTN